MEYLSLEKEFYKHPQEIHQIYEKRLSSDSSYQLDLKINDFPCFYVLNAEILKLIDSIYEINYWIEKNMNDHTLPLPAIHWLIITTLIEEIKTTNSIEGIRSTRKEIHDMIRNQSRIPYKRFYGLVNKYMKLVDDEDISLDSCTNIRLLYDEILLRDVLNEDCDDQPDGVLFRKEEVDISSGTKVIHKGVYGEKNIMAMMEKAIFFLNDENVNILVRVAVFHYLFEYIHPFYNGNGRMGRFLASAYLNKRLNILCSLQLSVACHHQMKDYYELFKRTSDIRNKSDLTIFIIGFLEIYLSGLEELKERLSQKINQYHHYIDIIKQISEKYYTELLDLLLQATLFGYDGMTLEQLSHQLKKTVPTVRKMIRELNQNLKIVEIQKSHKPYKYMISIQNIDNIKS